MTQFGKRLIKGLEEAVAIAKGEATPAKVYADVDVAKIRAKLKLSQSEFADLLDVSKRVVQDWEQHRKAPSGAARSLLKVAQKEPAAVRRALAR
jgi:putative transcriptional regulator